MVRRLAQEEGVFAGTSTGLNVVATLQLAQEVGMGGIVVIAACVQDSSTSMEHCIVTTRSKPIQVTPNKRILLDAAEPRR
jgi:hypothetical protein